MKSQTAAMGQIAIRMFLVTALGLAVCACAPRNKSAGPTKNVVAVAAAKATLGKSRDEVAKLLGVPYYGDDLEWHYYATDPATAREITCFVYFRPDTGIVRDVTC